MKLTDLTNKMTDNEEFRKVSFVRKLLEKKIDKLHECLHERLKILNTELDDFEELFERENEKDEAELKKLTQYRLNTIELFNAFDNQVIKIENRIEVLENRIEQRKVKLDFDDTSLTKQISSLGILTRMEDVSEGGYEVFGSLSEDNFLKYEVIDEVLMEEVESIKSKAGNHSTNHMTQVVYEDTVFTPGDYLKPSRQAPVPPKNRPPAPPVREKAPKPQHPMSPLHLRKDWATKSDEYTEINLDDMKQETELYCKVPEGKFQEKSFFRKKSISLGNKLNLTGISPGLSSHQDYLITTKCNIGAGPGQILKPKNIAISPKTGCIFVAEKGNNRIQVFAATGDPMYSFSRKTVTPRHSLVKPYGICILNEKVFVSVTQYSCIHAYKTNGEFIMQKGQEGKSEGNFEFPTGMNTDGTNKIYICDYGNNRVQTFSKDLQFKQVIGAGKLTNPTDIAVDHNLDLYVLDRSTTIVHQFNSKGVYQKKIIKIIKYPILSNPQFIAISPKGRIILSDILSNSVNIFSMEGSLRRTLGGPRDKEMFGEPRGLAFDMNGNLVVVCHKETGCLQIIDIEI